MTVSVVDPVYPAILPSLMEPISIDVTSDPLDMTITILYANGAWEVAYQDGVFSAVYEGSTRVTTHFEILRKGGWFPGRSFTVKVKETSPGVVTPPPIGDVGLGLKWRLLYGVDFKTLPSTPNFTPGPVTIDGKTWWLKGATPTVGTLAIKLLSGAGIYFDGNATQTESGTVQTPDKQLRLFLPFSNFPEYAPDAPLIVLGHISYSSGQAGGAWVYQGLINDTADAVYPTQTALDSRVGVIKLFNSYGVNTYIRTSNVANTPTPRDPNDEYSGIRIINKYAANALLYPVSGFVDPYVTPPYGGRTDPPGSPVGVPGGNLIIPISGFADAAKRGYSLSIGHTNGTLYTMSLVSLRIYQPKQVTP